MNYIIADSDAQKGIEMKRLLDAYAELDFQGSYTSIGAAEHHCLEHPPDIAFLRLGKPELNAIRLADRIRARNAAVKIIFVSNDRALAVEAFEYGADGFLLTPLSKDKIEQILDKDA